MNKKVTLKEVADRAGVTTATVSYVLNKKKAISKETTARVIQAVNDLEYVPNLAARSLSMQDSRLIGIVVPQTEPGGLLLFRNSFYSEILGSIEYSARQAGYHVLISATDVNEGYLKLVKERNLDGIIVIGMYPNAFYNQLKRAEVPIVMIDSYCNDHFFHNIRIDDAYGSYLATKYLISCGHRNIAFFTGLLKENGVMKKRLLGYEQALAEKHIPFRKKLVIEGKIDYDSGIEMAYTLLDEKLDVTAAAAAADILAIGAIKGFADRGVLVPEEISVIGYDDLEISQYMVPGLTTIRQGIHEKGERAVELLLKIIQNPQMTKREEILPVNLVIRQSVKTINEEMSHVHS